MGKEMEGQEMCGRFYIDDETAKEIEKIARRIDHKMAKMGEVHPSEPALILRAQKGETVSEVLQWGYGGAGKIIFNARSESVQERPMFRHDYENRRCIIPAKKFYEWRKSGGKQKEKYDFFSPGETLFLAGIYHKAPEGGRFTILTREAEGCMEGIHDRMPLILTRSDLERWLFSKEEAVRLLNGHYEELQRKKSIQEGYQQLTLF